MAQNEMKAEPALPERVRSMEGLGMARLLNEWNDNCRGYANDDDHKIRD